MSIDSRLNNIFDQYDVEENRVTNAFLQTLAKSRDFLKGFLNKHFNISPEKSANVIISAQKKPFAEGNTEEDKEKIEGIPDGWIIINEEIAIVFESKITKNAIRQAQLKAHVKRIRGYAQKYLCVITPDEESPVKKIHIPNTKIQWISWRKVYELVSKEKKGQGISGYFRNQLKEFLAMKKDLVGFQGIDYPSGSFNPQEARIIIKNLIREIKPNILEFYPKLQYERKSFSQDIHPYTLHHRDTWAFLGAHENFTKDIHLTFWLSETHMGMGFTIPNNARIRWRRLRQVFESDELFSTFEKKLFRLRNKLPNLYLEFVHRHYIRQRDGIVDGILEMDLDTVKGSKKIKRNERWLRVLRELVRNKKGYNGQLMIRTRFFYKKHPEIKTSAFKHTVIEKAREFNEVYNYL
jgi:hypothetical protein